jgi:hypothetical protein
MQTISAALQASQQAASAAVSRAALRQRQQEQLAALLGSERVLSGASARRLALGGTHQEQVRGRCLLLLLHCILAYCLTSSVVRAGSRRGASG